jgi:aminoglycoside phosphotransferase family enzyme
MAKKKLFGDIKAHPDRFYRLAADVVRDRRFDDDERLEILRAWAGQADAARLEQIGKAVADITRRKALRDHAAE